MAYTWFPGESAQPVAGLGTMPQNRMLTSQSGGAYLGGMAPQLPSQNMGFMWGDGAPGSSPSPYGGTGAGVAGAAPGGWSQSMLGSSGATGTPGITSTPPSYGGAAPNPYLSSQANDIQSRTQQMLGDSFAGINSQAVGTGGLGGSRQGVAQGIAGGRAADYMSGQLANLYGTQYNNDANRALQQYQGDQSFYLGNQGQNQNFYTANRGLDQSGAALGANLYNLGEQGQWSPYQNYGNTLSPYTGFGTTTGTTSQGGGGLGALGGGLAGWQIYQALMKNAGT